MTLDDTYATWSAWSMDYTTMLWVAWIAAFVVLEVYTGVRHQGEMLTDHLRPLFLSYPVLWWVTLGAALWAVVHLWFPALESALLDLVRARP